MKALAFARHAISRGVAELTLDHPGLPINKLSNEVWEGLDEALTLWAADESVRAVVIASAKPGVFVAGADIGELKLLASREAARASSERAQRVFGRLENLGKPVVCAVNGAALGGGMELTLAAHGVVAAGPKAKLGLPETKLGLLPGAGGTQRLARRLGPAAAGKLIVEGNPVEASAAQGLGLVHEIVAPDDLAAAARRMALRLADEGGFTPQWAPRGEGDPVLGYLAALRSLPSAADPRFEAWAAASAAVYFGAARPFDEGLRLESEAFADLAVGEAARALIDRFLRGERL